MAETRVERRLAAILAADVAGYSRLMGVDEEGTHSNLKAHCDELVEPKIQRHRGRIIKYTGDGFLAEFASVIDAVRCATEIQLGMTARNSEMPDDRRIDFRMGIHQGDIIVDSGDIFGDGVNVAARLEGIAKAGGICVSGRVQEDVAGRLDVAFEDAGEHQLKNIARPVRVFRVRLDAGVTKSRLVVPLAIPERPSIAVLPFQNMSDDPEHEYFADGTVEDIITALSRFKSLFVIARNSSFTYKGHAVDVKQAGREMGVRYVLEGSVRKSANSVRITAQLIDASTGAHLWADRFDSALKNIFELQDQIAAAVVGAISPALEKAEIERTKRKPTDSLDAYDNLLRGMANIHKITREAMSDALRFFYKAIELDPEYAHAHGMAAWCYARSNANGWTTDRQKDAAEADRLARRAIELASDDANVLCLAGAALAFAVCDIEGATDLVDQAILLNPNLAWAWNYSGWIRIHLGHWDTALDHFNRALRLSPLDPLKYNMYAGIAFAHFLAGHYDETRAWVDRALRAQPNYLPAVRVAMVNDVWTGRIDEAKRLMGQMRALDPALSISNLKEVVPLRQPEHFTRYEEGMRKAGLPDR
jgi:TolB-like protein/class 3 adenylate cyclase/Tfp pilus assembly protein PilF